MFFLCCFLCNVTQRGSVKRVGVACIQAPFKQGREGRKVFAGVVEVWLPFAQHNPFSVLGACTRFRWYDGAGWEDSMSVGKGWAEKSVWPDSSHLSHTSMMQVD